MQTWNIIESDFALRHNDIQNSEHQNFEDRNIRKFAACLSESATRHSHATQLRWWLYLENHLLSHHLESSSSEWLDSRRRKNFAFAAMIFTMTFTRNNVAIVQYHRDQWKQR